MKKTTPVFRKGKSKLPSGRAEKSKDVTSMTRERGIRRMLMRGIFPSGREAARGEEKAHSKEEFFFL